MRVITRAILDIETLLWIEVEGYEYGGPVELCKGGGKGFGDQQKQNILDMQKARNAEMQVQLAKQLKALGAVDPSLDAIIQSGGMLPQTEAAAQSLFLNQLPADFNSLQGQLANRLVQRGVTGGGMAGSGDIARNFGGLFAQEDIAKAQGLSNIQLQKEKGLRQALGMKLGEAGMFGQQGLNLGGQALGFLSQSPNVISATNAASTPGFLGPMFGALGGFAGAPFQ